MVSAEGSTSIVSAATARRATGAAPSTAFLILDTESVPDGNYLIKVVASDERANPKGEAMEHSLISAPQLVDNRKPEIELKISGSMVNGKARDSFSPISEMAFSVDGGEWQPLGPKDGIFDDLVEEFSFKLPDNLGGGAHSVAIRAVDSGDNVGAVQSSFRIK